MLTPTIHGVPGDEAGHHHRLAGPGRHPKGKSRETPAPAVPKRLQAPHHPVGAVPALGQEDDRLDSLALRVEGAEHRALARLASPVLKELTSRIARAGPTSIAPRAHLASELVDGASHGGLVIEIQTLLKRDGRAPWGGVPRQHADD